LVLARYHKRQSTTRRARMSVHFLTESDGALLLKYIIYVLPWRNASLRVPDPQTQSMPFFWQRHYAVWADGSLKDCLKVESVTAGVAPLTVKTWRQISVAIVKVKFPSTTQQHLDL
ncbi:hypothetical protein K470DRAFT_191962, partial [Piedraia hortae CBS 480.64]